tara:strand:+ start:2004 stop:2192 length:189 start_codon:yes stop_codon:yes gene_type:complete
MFENPRKKIIIKDGNKLLVDFDTITIDEPKSNDMDMGEIKLKKVINKPIIKTKKPKKGKSLF